MSIVAAALRRFPLSMRLATLVAIILIGADGALLLFMPQGWPPRQLWFNILMIAGRWLAALGLLHAYRHTPPAPNLAARQAWGILAFTHVALALVRTGWLVLDETQGLNTAALNWVGTLGLLYYLSLIIALLWLAPAFDTVIQRLRLLLDLSALSVASGMVLWLLSSSNQLVDDSQPNIWIYRFAFPLSEIALLVAVVIVAAQFRRPFRVMILLGGGFAAHLVANLIFGNQSLSAMYHLTGWFHPLWLLGDAVLALAGLAQANTPLPYFETPFNPPPAAKERRFPASLPYLLVGMAFLLLAWVGNQLFKFQLAALTAWVGGLTMLVLARQLLTLRENRTMLHTEQQRRESDALLLDFSRRVLGAPDASTVYEHTLTTIHTALQADLSFVFTLNAQEQLMLRAQYGLFLENASSEETAIDLDSQVGHTLRTGQPITADYTRQQPFQIPPEFVTAGVQAGLSAPMFTQDKVTGVLAVHTLTPRVYTPEDIDLLSLVANQAATALEKLRLFQVAQRQLDELSVLQAVASAGTEADTEAELIQRVSQVVHAVFPEALKVSVLLLNETTGELVVQAATDGGLGFTTTVGRGITGQVAASGQSRRVADVYLEPAYLRDHPDTRSELSVPIKVGEHLFGVLDVEHGQTAAFNETDERLMTTVAQQLALALEKLRLLAAEKRRVAALTSLHDINLDLTAQVNLASILQRIVARAAAMLEAAYGALYLWRADRQRLEVVVNHNFGPAMESLTLHLGEDLAGRVAASSEALILDDYAVWSARLPALQTVPIGAIIGMPIAWHSQLLGVMCLADPRSYRFSQADLEMVSLFSDQAAVAIANGQLYAETQRRLREQTLLYETSQELSQSRDAHTALAAAAERVARWLGASGLGYYTYDESAGALYLDYEYLAPDAYPPAVNGLVTWTLAETPALAAAFTMRVPRLLRLAEENLTPTERRFIERRNAKAVIILPMAVHEQVIGLLEVWDSRAERVYDEADQRLLLAFATQAAVAKQNARLFAAEQQRAAELEAVRQAGLALTASLDLGMVLRAILQSTMRLVPDVAEAYIFLYNDEAKLLTFGASLTRQGEADATNVWVPRSDGLTYTVANTGRMMVVPNMHQDALFASMADDWGGAIVGLPLKIGERVVGVMNVVYPEPRAFPDWELRVLRLLGDQASITIENARLFSGERVARAQAEALREVALNASLDRESLLNLLLGQLARVVSYDNAAVLWLTTPQQLSIVATDGFQAEQHPTPLKVSRLPHIQEVLETRRPVIIANTTRDARWHPTHELDSIRCWLGVPLVAQGRVIGLLTLAKEQTGFYTERDANLVTAFANQAAVALENARLFEAERRQLRLAQTLQAVGALLTAQMSLNEVFDQIFRLLAQVVQYDSVAVQLFNEANRLDLAAGRGFADWDQAEVTVRQLVERWATAHWLEQRLIVIPDTTQDAHWMRLEGNAHIRSWIGSALVAKGDLVGLLTVDSTTPLAYDASTGETVRAFANQAAVAIVNARLFDDLQRQTRTLSSLYDTALAIGSVLDQEVLFKRLYEQVQLLLNPDTFLLLLYRADTDALEVAFAIENGRLVKETLPLEPLPTSDGLTGFVVRSRQSLLVNDLKQEPLPAQPRYDTQTTRAWMGVPLIVRDRVVGVVSAQSFHANAFKNSDLRFMESIASQAAIALENARLYTEVSARVNELSQLYLASQDLSATLEPRLVLEKLARHLAEAVGATSGYVVEVDLNHDSMSVLAKYWSLAAAPEERASDLGRTYVLSTFPTIKAAILAQTTTVLHVNDPSLGSYERDQYTAYGIQSALVVPIVARGQAVGYAEIWESRRHRDFTLAERRLLQTLCQHAAGSLENARLFAETARHAEEVTLATTILHLLNVTAEIGDAFQHLTPHLKQISGCERVSLAMFDAQQTKVTIWALDRPRPEFPPGSQVAISATAAAANILAGQIHLSPDLAAESHFPAEKALYEAGYRSRANLPLRAGDRVIGALTLVWLDTKNFSQVNLPLLSQIAEAIALAIEKARLFDETRRRDVLLEALAYAGEQLLLPGDLSDILPDVLAHLGSAAQASRAYLFEQYNAEGLLLARLVVSWAAPGQVSHNMPYLVLSSLERWASTLQVGRPLAGLSRDMPTEERDLLQGYDILSVVVVPIFQGNHVWGFLCFDDTAQERIWSAAEIEALKSAAGALGAALVRQQSETAEREQRALAEALRDTTAALNSTLDQSEVLDRILTDVGRVVPHDSANILLIENGIARVARSRAAQHTSDFVGNYVVHEVANLRKILETGQPVIVSDAHAYPGWASSPEIEWIRANVGAPIRIKGQIIGFIILDSITPDFFTQAHADRLQAFAHQAGLAFEHAQLYEATRRHADELEQRVTERTRELAEANVRLRELDRLKDEFISNVSHELRTPLTNINLHLALIDKRGADALPKHMPVVMRETRHLRRLIEDLLDLSRLQTGYTLQPETVPIASMLEEVIVSHTARAEARNLDIQLQCAPPDLTLKIDRAKITQVFNNLVGNAVAYTPPGGHITVTTLTGNTTAQIGLQIHNTSAPIPPEDLPHLFDRFYRGRTGRDSGEPGTGLGLAICREIVERHGGRIEVASDEGGTTFTVWLPAETG
jgi:GAF domain-containing protein